MIEINGNQFVYLDGKRYPVNSLSEVEQVEDTLDILGIDCTEVYQSPHEAHILERPTGRVVFAKGGLSHAR